MTVVDIDGEGITFVKNGIEQSLTWGELNYLKRYKSEGVKDSGT
jgi:hypothetical protein